ncbi:MAG TPA: ABC transporter substrate-binding protein, partial [Candidatus Berkiella sp.]|nr:ABC transporter substrate-binding protein [Candidatus Berkiella sp.]
MLSRQKILSLLIVTLLIACTYFIVHLTTTSSSALPKIAIAHYGPHNSLEESIRGIKEGLAQQGFKDKENISIEVLDVNFDLTLIPQMLAKLCAMQPQAMVVISTPIAQNAKNTIKDIPLFFTDVTEPILAGLLKDNEHPLNNMTGASDKQDLNVLLAFAQQLLPHAKRVGLLYASSEANDIALVNMLKDAAKKINMEVVCIPVEHARDIPFRMQALKNKVDFIYVGV